ncbi:hypothetical protein GCM10023143_07290 [Compostibacter hankyongensis]|uniref:Uncharacterized protein n=2 Tax=Compostibacter hankyongensis TaxID=1007089 RepID=A0ABP8FGZ7_9BACT
MIYVAIILFSLAILLGLGFIYRITRKKSLPKAAVYAHGAFAISACIVLGVDILQHLQGRHYMQLFSLVNFAPAVLMGFVLYFSGTKKNRLPPLVIGAHAGLALIAFIILVAAVL